MPKFSAMSLAELTRPEGYDCACGKHHAVDLPWIRIERGALNALPEALKGRGRPSPLRGLRRQHLPRRGRARGRGAEMGRALPFQTYIVPCRHDRIAPSEWELGSMMMHFDPACDFIARRRLGRSQRLEQGVRPRHGPQERHRRHCAFHGRFCLQLRLHGGQQRQIHTLQRLSRLHPAGYGDPRAGSGAHALGRAGRYGGQVLLRV